MRKKLSIVVSLLLAAILLTTGLPNRVQAGAGPKSLSGKFSISSGFYDNIPFIVGLNDASGLFGKDPVYITPKDKQTIGKVTGSARDGQYTLEVPDKPAGRALDVMTGTAANTVDSTGVLVFDVRLMTDIPTRGYQVPNEDSVASSLKLSVDDFVQGGTFLVWAADDKQQFPTGMGTDKKLFTADDPRAPLAAGWSLINLDSEPFKVSHEADAKVDLTTTGIGDVVDYTSLSCADMVTAFLDRVQKYYPFTKMKHIDWQALRDKLIPASKAAKSNADCDAVIRDFGNAIPDGHVDFQLPSLRNELSGNLGLRLTQTTDNKIVVPAIGPGMAADQAGIKIGAEITTWDDKPIQKAINDLVLLFANSGTSHGLLATKLLQITYGSIGSTVKITFQNPGEAAKTVTLTRGANTRVPAHKDPPKLDNNKLPSGIGYIRIANFDDMNVYRATEQALDQLIKDNVPGIILDVRSNPGGLSQISDALVSRYFDKGFIVGKVLREDGGYVYLDQIDPRQPVYHGLVAVLVNADTASTGDIFAYSFKAGKRGIIVGHTPSAGMAGSPGGGQYYLPGGGFIQVPTSDFVDESGQTIIEGQGVIPDVLVPVTADSVMSSKDDVIDAAEQALLKGQKP